MTLSYGIRTTIIQGEILMTPIKKALLVTAAFAYLAIAPDLALAQGAQRSIQEDLMYRISFGRPDDVKVLLDKNAETNTYGSMGDTPLTLAVNRNPGDGEIIIKALLAKGADPNFPDKNGIYPLEVAIKQDKVMLVKALIEGGADVQMRTLEGVSMSDLAFRLNKKATLDVINEKIVQDKEHEQKMYDPQRLLSLIHQFSTNICEMNYWNSYYVSLHNPAENPQTKEKIEKNRLLAEKTAQQITMYFPTIKIDTYIKYSADSINNVFKMLPDNKARDENNIGKEEDAHRRCKEVADVSRQSIDDVLKAQKQTEEDAAKKAELLK